MHVLDLSEKEAEGEGEGEGEDADVRARGRADRLYLTLSKVPDYVRNLPGDFASTPLGAMMVPMIDSFFKSMGGSGAPVGGSIR